MNVLEAKNLSVEYRIGKQWLNVIRDVTLSIKANEIHGLVGESGSGKSTLALALMRYLEANARISAGQIAFDGRDLCQLSSREAAQLWGKHIALVPQNPLDALNPTLTIAQQMTEVTRLHLGLTPAQAYRHAAEGLQSVKLADPERLLARYPHQLSGGQQQRVMIAMALSTRPRLLVLDEPTTALDVTTQAVILDLIRDLVRTEGASALYVSHNLGTIAQLCDTVTVLYGGEVMETAPVVTLFKTPSHPYTIGLLASLPQASEENETRLATIGGVAPALAERPQACVFAPRCAVAIERCHHEKPALLDDGTRAIRCWRADEIASSALTVRQTPPPAPADVPPKAEKVITVRGLSKRFTEARPFDRLLGRTPVTVKAVTDASFHVNGRSTLGVVGESGSGKTTLARAIVGLTPAQDGAITLMGIDIPNALEKRPPEALRNLRMIFQNPNDALNPYKTVGQTLTRTLVVMSDGKMNLQARTERIAQLLESVGLTTQYAARYPSQLSGGEKQRVAIARAFAANPALIVADEPTSALDVSVQAVILNVLKDLRAREGASYMLISHDLDVVAMLADWIVVMYLGEIVEQGTTAQVYQTPSHPYTEALLSAIPAPDPTQRGGQIRLEGDVPSPRDKPSGCPFHTRCPRFIGQVCVTDTPPERVGENGHRVRCHHTLEALQALQNEEMPT